MQRASALRLVGRYPGWWSDSPCLPRRLFKTPSGREGSWIRKDPSTYRCGGSSGWGVAGDPARPFLIPVELRRVNHVASTNAADSIAGSASHATRASGELRQAVGVLLQDAQRAGAVRHDVELPEVYALLVATSRGVTRAELDEAARAARWASSSTACGRPDQAGEHAARDVRAIVQPRGRRGAGAARRRRRNRGTFSARRGGSGTGARPTASRPPT